MALTKFNTSLATLDRLSMHLYGAYGAGKTHLAGDFLRWASAQGKVAYLNITGEDGQSSLAGLGLGEVGYTAESMTDYDAALIEFKTMGLTALAVDSLTALYKRQLLHTVGEVRYPEPARDGEKAKMWWGQISMGINDRVVRSRGVAKYVLWVSPFDRSDDAVGGGKGLTPDLPGKLAYGNAGWFDLVGLLRAETMGVGKIKRTADFTPQTGALTRQRLPRPLTQPIEIPEGEGGWARIFAAVSATFTQPTKETSK